MIIALIEGSGARPERLPNGADAAADARHVVAIVGLAFRESCTSPTGWCISKAKIDPDRVTPGTEVTGTLMIRLTSIASDVGVAEPFRVRAAT